MIFAYWRYTNFFRTMMAESCLLPPEPDTTEGKLLETIIRQMAEAQGIDEDLKARDQMAWVGAMNNIKSAALEILRESK